MTTLRTAIVNFFLFSDAFRLTVVNFIRECFTINTKRLYLYAIVSGYYGWPISETEAGEVVNNLENFSSKV